MAGYALDKAVEVTKQEDGGVAMSFTLEDVSKFPALVEALRYRATPDGGKQLVYEELGRQVSASFRTATLSGAVKMSITFMVTPGAQLFVSPKAGEEQQVAQDKIAADGTVAMDVPIVRGQESVYARTVLGEVEKCIKIDLFTGAITEVTKANYQAQK
ncbi:hypothetical protein LLH03_16370 [bacterium]|nr:hypothetical protein [bacterium]